MSLSMSVFLCKSKVFLDIVAMIVRIQQDDSCSHETNQWDANVKTF